MTITKSLFAAALLSTVAAVSFAQTPAVVAVPAAKTATVAASAPVPAASKPAAKKHKAKKASPVTPMASVTK